MKGRSDMVKEFWVDNKEIIVIGKYVKTARLKNEWYEDVDHPLPLADKIKESGFTANIFTFWQRLPEITPKYNYYMEYDSIAVITIKSFNHWWEKQIKSRTRGLIRKAKKKGVVVKITEFNDDFVRGITNIFNETSVRQGKPFWHYGKNFDIIKKEFSRHNNIEDYIGAYYNGELIGFIFLAYAGKFALLSQILSKIEHRDKLPNNALMAKAVKICAKKEIPYLVYSRWVSGSLGEFKRRNGFQEINLPRYYIPLTIMGNIAIRARLHHGISGIIPDTMKERLKDIRKKWYTRKHS